MLFKAWIHNVVKNSNLGLLTCSTSTFWVSWDIGENFKISNLVHDQKDIRGLFHKQMKWLLKTILLNLTSNDIHKVGSILIYHCLHNTEFQCNFVVKKASLSLTAVGICLIGIARKAIPRV